MGWAVPGVRSQAVDRHTRASRALAIGVEHPSRRQIEKVCSQGRRTVTSSASSAVSKPSSACAGHKLAYFSSWARRPPTAGRPTASSSLFCALGGFVACLRRMVDAANLTGAQLQALPEPEPAFARAMRGTRDGCPARNVSESHIRIADPGPGRVPS